MNHARHALAALVLVFLQACGGGGGDSGGSGGGIAQPELLITLDAGGALVDVDGSSIFYTKADGSGRLRNAAGAETVIAVPANTTLVAGSWRLGSGNVFALGTNPVDPAGTSVYRWKDGSATRLVNPNPVGTGAKTLGGLMVASPFAAWTESGMGDAGHVTVYNADTAAFRRIDTPATAKRPPEEPAGVAVGGALKLTFWSSTLPVGSLFIDSLPSDIYTWDSASGSTTQVTNVGLAGISRMPSTDGSRLFWLSRPVSGAHSLLTGTFGASGSTVLAAASGAVQVAQFGRTDSVVAWVETSTTSTQTARTLKVSVAGAAPTTIPTQSLGTLFTGPGGHIVYADNGALYSWDAAAGRRPLLDSVPTSVVVSGDFVYYVKPGTQQVYKQGLK